MSIETAGLTAAYKNQLPVKPNKALASKMTGQVNLLQHAASIDQVRFSSNSSSATVTIAGQKKLLQRGQEALRKQIDELQKAQGSRSDWENGLSGLGAYVGMLAGFVAETTMHVLTLGGSVVVVGTGVIGGAAAGKAVGSWIGRSLSTDSDPATLQKEINRRKADLKYLAQNIQAAESAMSILEEYGKKAQTAKNGNFVDREKLNLFAASDYQDVRDKYQQIEPDLAKLGVILLSDKTVKAIRELIADSASNKPEDRVLALQRLYPLEKQDSGTLSNSRSIYQERLLRDEDETVRAAALQAMVEEPALRMDDKPFLKVIENMLVNPQLLKTLMVVLDAVDKTAYKSSTINYHLERIGNPLNKFDGMAQQKAQQLLVTRQEAGLYKPLNSREAAKNIMQGIVGNPKHERRLVTALQQYKGAVQEIGKPDAALRLTMAGEPGIGKTLLVSRLHNELNNDETGFVH